MFSLFKHKSENPEVPEWAAFFSSSEYSEFINAINNYFKKKNVTYELGDGMLSTGENIFGFASIGLINVAQVCKQNKQRNYRKIVSEHFDSMVSAYQFEMEFNKIVHDFDKVKKYIGVRLYPNDYVGHIGKELTVGKDFAGDIYSMLIFDLPESITNVQPHQIEQWGRPFEELFEVGKQNIKHNYPLNISQHKFNELAIWFVEGNHFFAPNIVFDLNNYPKLLGSKGSIVGIPHRHSVIIYPIENLEIVTAINQLIPAIYGMNEEGPGSISNNLFWYNDGHFENLPYKIEDNKLQFFPPQNFAEMVKTLSAKP